MPQRDDEILVELIQRLSVRVAVVVASGFVVLGFLVRLIPRSQGWFSLVGQTELLWWSLAFFVMVAWGIGALRRAADRALFKSGVDIADLTWEQFEGYLAEFFRRRGSIVTYRGGASADGGVDRLLDGPEGRRIVQAKHWKARRVDVVTVRALWGVKEDERATGAVVVTSGRFTPDAERFARGKAIALIDGARLRKLIAEVKGRVPELGTPAIAASEKCPQCRQGRLVERRAKRGPNAGSLFLGCSRFPECRYVRHG